MEQAHISPTTELVDDGAVCLDRRFESLHSPEGEAHSPKIFLLLSDVATLLDTSLLTGEGAEVVELSATYLTELLDGNLFDEGAFHSEDTLYAYTFTDLTHREALLFAVTADADDDATIALDTFLTPFADAVVNGDGVTATEGGVALTRSESFVDDLNKVHC